jgi:preprotein translocase subunit SecA
MSILNSVIKLFVGDKQQKDLKILQPVVNDVKKFLNQRFLNYQMMT